MVETIQFRLNVHKMAKYLEWRQLTETAQGQPLSGIIFSFLLTVDGMRQIIVRPSTEEDLRLKGVPRSDGTYDEFLPHEEVLAEYDDLGFASITVEWPDVELKLYFCDGTIMGRETTPRRSAVRNLL
jgi:hypothetical protein